MSAKPLIQNTAIECHETDSTNPREDLLSSVAALAKVDPDRFVDELEWNIDGTLDLLPSLETNPSPAAVFQSKTWLGNWAKSRTTSGKQKLYVITGSLGTNQLVCLPILVSDYRMLKIGGFAGQEYSDYNRPVLHPCLEAYVAPPLVKALWNKAADLIPELDLIELRKALCDHEEGEGCNLRHWQEPEASHQAELTGNWDEDLSRFVGKSSRKSLNRKLKSLRKLGSVEFREVSGAAAKVEATKVLSDWKREQLREKGIANKFKDAEFVAFLERVAADESTDMVRIYGMYLEDAPIALTFMMCTNKRWFLYQTAYTTGEPGRFSPGYHLLLDIMRQASEKNVPIFDFGWGNESYKLRFATRSIPLHRIAVPKTIKGILAMHAITLTMNVKRIVKSNRFLRSGALAVLRALD